MGLLCFRFTIRGSKMNKDELENKIKDLKVLVTKIPIRKTIPLQRQIVELEKILKEINDKTT